METISRSLLTFLLNAAWQIPLVAAVAAAACWFMRNGPARNRYALWVAARAISIALPLASVRREDQLSAPLSAVSLPLSNAATLRSAPRAHSPSPPKALSPVLAPRTVSLTESTAKLLLSAYLLFILLRLWGLLRAVVRTIQIPRTAQAVALPEQLDRVHRRCEETLCLTRVRLLFSTEIQAPATAGRAIILPDSLLTETSEDLLTTAVGHEMAHIARRDFLYNILFELIFLPVSVQPVAWLIRRGIGRAREMACDELVTERMLGAHAYARALVSMAASMTAV